MKIVIDISQEETDMSAVVDRLMAAVEAASNKIDKLIEKTDALQAQIDAHVPVASTDDDVEAAAEIIEDLNKQLDEALKADEAETPAEPEGGDPVSEPSPETPADEPVGPADTGDTGEGIQEGEATAQTGEDTGTQTAPVDAGHGQLPAETLPVHEAPDGQPAVDAPKDNPTAPESATSVEQAKEDFPAGQVTEVPGGVKIEGTF